MDLVFSWFADSGAWPEIPGKCDAVLGQEVVGPLRLLDHAETMLGLGRLETPAVRRIAAYRRKVQEAGDGRFWSNSFSVDSWSTTRELLLWRDELVEAGWRPGVGTERSRIADITVAELAGPLLPPGRADRLRAAIDALEDARTVSIKVIRLVDDRSVLPTGWRALLDALERAGTEIKQLPVPTPKSVSGDIRLLAADEAGSLAGDGTICVLSADTEIAAADAIVSWLAADPLGNRNTTFVVGSGTSLLDRTLAARGLPTFGASAASPQRAVLQVLPLAYALAWDPPDPNRLLDFLLLPNRPLPRRAANLLAEAVAKEPGIGGKAWLAAWQIILGDAGDEQPAKHAAKVADWRRFVEPPRHDPVAGMPANFAKEIASRVSSWAGTRIANDSAFAALASVARDLSAAVDDLGLDRLDRVLVERMAQEALGAGISDPGRCAEAAPWRSVAHPGAVWGEARTVVWWGFSDYGETAAYVRWNEAERATLAREACPLDEPELGLRLLSDADREDLISLQETWGVARDVLLAKK